MPTRFTPITWLITPWTIQNGGMSWLIADVPPRNASRPTRQNWWTAVLPDRNAWSWISACPPTTAPLARMQWSPTRQSWARWLSDMK